MHGRCKYHLSESSVALILQSVLGGHPDGFRVHALDLRVFRFSVQSQEVGFHVYHLRAFECQNFKIYFHLGIEEAPILCLNTSFGSMSNLLNGLRL